MHYFIADTHFGHENVINNLTFHRIRVIDTLPQRKEASYMMTIKEILKLDSGLYTADVDGKPAIIGRDKGKGFTIRTESTPGWYMINHYDEDGDYEGMTFEPKDKE